MKLDIIRGNSNSNTMTSTSLQETLTSSPKANTTLFSTRQRIQVSLIHIHECNESASGVASRRTTLISLHNLLPLLTNRKLRCKSCNDANVRQTSLCPKTINFFSITRMDIFTTFLENLFHNLQLSCLMMRSRTLTVE